MCVTGYQTRNVDSMHSPQSCSPASTHLIQWQHLNASYRRIKPHWSGKPFSVWKQCHQLSPALRWACKWINISEWALGSATREEWSRVFRAPISHSYLSSSQSCFGDNRKKHLWLRVWMMLFWWTFSTYFIHSIVQEMTLASHIMHKTVLPIIGINTNTICLAPFNTPIILINTQTTSVHRQKYRYLCHSHFLKHCTKFSINFC